MAKKDSSKDGGKRRCGIVMPISDCEGYQPGHWERVLHILEEAVSDFYEVSLVSAADEVTIIQKTIVKHLAEDDLVICDVSSKNPNVMFELGIRLTFDRPTVIIKDDITDYSFDTGIVEHLGYRSDLRFQDIVDFKDKLLGKCTATVKMAAEDANYSPFIAHFGSYKVQQPPSTDVDTNEYMVALMQELREDVSVLRRDVRSQRKTRPQVEFSSPPLPLASEMSSSYLNLVFPKNLLDRDAIKAAIQKLHVSGWTFDWKIVAGESSWAVDVRFHTPATPAIQEEFREQFIEIITDGFGTSATSETEEAKRTNASGDNNTKVKGVTR